MAVPNIFANVTTSIPLSQLDANFATAITLGNTAVYLGNTTTTLGNLTLTNVTLSSGTSNLASTSISNGTSNVSIASSGGNITMATNGTSAITVDTSQGAVITGLVRSSGNGFQSGNTTDAFAKFNYDGGNAALDITNEYNSGGAGSTYGQIVFKNYNSSGGSLTERMRIAGSGNLLYNTTSASVASASGANNGGINFRNDGTSGNGVIDIARTGDFPLNLNRLSTTGGLVNFLYNGSAKGTISTDGTNVAYNTSSDYRLKENIAPMTGALAKVAQLKPVTFKWIQNGSNSEGFIAHELAEVCPHAVSGEKDATREEEYELTPAVKDEEGKITTPAVMGTRTVPDYQGIDVSFLVATLTAAIQEQQATITALTARIVALESK